AGHEGPAEATEAAAAPPSERRAAARRRKLVSSPWKDLLLLGKLRQQAEALVPLKTAEAERFLCQGIHIQQGATRICSHVPEEWDYGTALLNSWESRLWLRHPDHKDKTFFEYGAWL